VDVRVIEADLGQRDQIVRAADRTQDLDVGLLVACAGFGTSGPLVDADLANEIDMVDVNCTSVLAMVHHFAPRFAARGRGGIVLMSSIMAFQGVPLAANYAATKAYVQVLAEGLRQELAPAGVDVLASAPGPVLTGFAARARMKMGLGLSPAKVARPTLAALGRRTTVRPGLLSILLESSFIGQPRGMRGWILGRIMRGMTDPHAAPR
jgi:short-subunit dehydrogenase